VPPPAPGNLGYAAPTDKWEPLRSGIEAWAALDLDAKFSVHVGDETGNLFTYVSPGFTTKTEMQGASLSKWPSAIMISGLVNDGTMSYDDPAHKYLDWWTKDPSDSRSKVTLRHLLSFTSGYMSDSMSGCGYGGEFSECAKKLYENSKHKAAPGTQWAYLSCHLQFAGAMAVAASGKPIYDLFDEYLYKPFNMTGTSWNPRRNPSMAGGITTTAADFDNLLHRLLTYKVLPKAVLDQMETDYSQPPVEPSGDGWFGHYAMGHWWECMGYGTPNERAALPKARRRPRHPLFR
jgi:CubicO group peptidase (beta-lactamase class C family)